MRMAGNSRCGKMLSAKTPALNVAYLEFGAEATPPVVMLHDSLAKFGRILLRRTVPGPFENSALVATRRAELLAPIRLSAETRLR